MGWFERLSCQPGCNFHSLRIYQVMSGMSLLYVGTVSVGFFEVAGSKNKMSGMS